MQGSRKTSIEFCSFPPLPPLLPPLVDLVHQLVQPLLDQLLVPLGHPLEVRNVLHHQLCPGHRVVQGQEGHLEVGEEALERKRFKLLLNYICAVRASSVDDMYCGKHALSLEETQNISSCLEWPIDTVREMQLIGVFILSLNRKFI